eukprot:m.318039 g.318039  ORF g.318039 m.318039 type:complete len:178 (-) comp55482_c0_seq2:853-1386(-)
MLVGSPDVVPHECTRGLEALHIAAMMNQSRAVLALLANGAHINAQNQFGFTPLECAKRMRRNYSAAIDALISFEIGKLTKPASRNRSAMTVAFAEQHEEMLSTMQPMPLELQPTNTAATATLPQHPAGGRMNSVLDSSTEGADQSQPEDEEEVSPSCGFRAAQPVPLPADCFQDDFF